MKSTLNTTKHHETLKIPMVLGTITHWPQSATWSTHQVAHWAPGKDPWRFGTSKVWWYIYIVYVCDNEYIIYIYYTILYIYTLYIIYIYVYIHYKYIQIYRYTWLYVCIQVGILSFPSTFFISGETSGKSGALGWVEPAERWAASVPRRWFGLETPWQLEVYNAFLGPREKKKASEKKWSIPSGLAAMYRISRAWVQVVWLITP